MVSPIAYLGHLMDGDRALGIGLAHGIIEIETDIRTSARSFLERLSRLEPKAYATTKAAILDTLDATFEQSLALGAR